MYIWMTCIVQGNDSWQGFACSACSLLCSHFEDGLLAAYPKCTVLCAESECLDFVLSTRIAAINLAAEYALAASAIAKGFTSYFASIIGQKHGFLTIPISDIFEIDLLSFVIIVLLSLVLIWGIKQSSRVQNCIAMVNLITILVVLGATFPFFNSANMSPFIPKEFGYRGVFHAASVVFFSYLGFDTVATAAEEVKNPKKDVPIGIVGSIFISGFLFMAMALGIVGMRRYAAANEEMVCLSPCRMAVMQ